MSHFYIAVWVLIALLGVPVLANILLGGPNIQVGLARAKQQERVSTAILRYWLGGDSANENTPHVLHVAMQLAVVIGSVYLCRLLKVPDYMGLAAVGLVVWRGKKYV